jgi:superfamily II DNA or RNA helicase
MIQLGNFCAFHVQDPNPILTVLPDAKYALHKGKHVVAVPNTFKHLQVMRSLGLNAPVSLDGYKWPGRFKPYEHQRNTTKFLVENKRAYVLSGLGTGKTLSLLWAADYLMEQKVVKRALIVAPLSCLERVWADSIYQSFPRRKFVVLHGSRQQRLDLLKSSWDFAVINPHGINIIQDKLPQDVELIIIDELATFRTHTAKTLWGAAKAMIKPHHWVWGATGTPTPNAPTDAYAQSKLVTPERYNGSFTRFKMGVMMQISQFKYVPRHNAQDQVNQILQPSIRYALEDCIELPETIYHMRDSELSPEQKHHYQKLRKECMTEIDGRQVTAVNAAVLCGKLLQASLGILYHEGETVELDFGPRLAVLEECIEESDGKVIIFAPLTGVIHSLYNKLKKKYHCAVVTGATSSGARNKTFSDFNNAETPQIIIAAPQCMSHGLSLHHKCSSIIWFSGIASNETFTQANARTVRPGQTKHTNIFMIAATPVERKIYQTLQERGKFQDCVLEIAKEKY